MIQHCPFTQGKYFRPSFSFQKGNLMVNVYFFKATLSSLYPQKGIKEKSCITSFLSCCPNSFQGLPWRQKKNRARQTLTRSQVWSFATRINCWKSSHLRTQTFWLLLQHWVFPYLNPTGLALLRSLECLDAVTRKECNQSTEN